LYLFYCNSNKSVVCSGNKRRHSSWMCSIWICGWWYQNPCVWWNGGIWQIFKWTLRITGKL